MSAKYDGVHDLISSLETDIKRLQPSATPTNASEAMLRPLCFVASQVQQTHTDLTTIFRDYVRPMHRTMGAIQPALAALQSATEKVAKTVDTSDIKAQLFVLQESVTRIESGLATLSQRVARAEHTGAMAMEKIASAECTAEILSERLRRVEGAPTRKRTFADMFSAEDDIQHLVPPPNY